MVLFGLLLLWLFFPLLLRGAAWCFPSLGGVAVFLHLFGGAAFLPLLWVVVRFSCLLLGGAAWSPPSFWVARSVELSSFSSFGWGCVSPLFCFFWGEDVQLYEQFPHHFDG